MHVVFGRPEVIVTLSVKLSRAEEFTIQESSICRGNIAQMHDSMELSDSIDCSKIRSIVVIRRHLMHDATVALLFGLDCNMVSFEMNVMGVSVFQ